MPDTIDLSTAQHDPEAPLRFLDRLATLMRGDWLEAADRARHQGDRSAAVALLDAVITHQGLAVDAWYVDDGVETAIACVFGSRARGSPADDELVRAARSAASVAARCLVARALLSVDHFDALYHPFAVAIPAATVVSA